MTKWQAWTLVGIQFALIIALVTFPPGNLYPQGPFVVIASALLVFAGLGVAAAAGVRLGSALTPSPIPREKSSLQTGGIYRVVRHPIYSGLLLMGAGLALFGASVLHIASYLALIVLLALKARAEERLLLETFEDYARYASNVGRFFPGVGRMGKTEGS